MASLERCPEEEEPAKISRFSNGFDAAVEDGMINPRVKGAHPFRPVFNNRTSDGIRGNDYGVRFHDIGIAR